MKNKQQLNLLGKYTKIAINDTRISDIITDINNYFEPIQIYKNYPNIFKNLITEENLFFSGGHLQVKLRKAELFRNYSLQEKVLSFGKLAMITYILKEKNLKTQQQKFKMLGKLRIALINFSLETDHNNGNIWDNSKTNLILRSKKNHDLKHAGLLKTLKDVE
jgi:hypothetical protein